MRLMCFDYCLQIRSDQQNKTPQKQPELCCSHWGPCYRLIPPLCRAQPPAQQLLLSWERSQLSQSGIPNGSHGICPSLLDQGFLLPCALHSTLKKVLQSLLHSQGSKGSPACCWEPKILRCAHTITYAL